ncbi:T9SS type A sorting domain-containing protein [Bacteroidia bacterium]|nr:T9SS type A sorting domain-containing protein [Bacteroidia bacterium]
MKKITTLCSLVLLTGLSYAQNAPIDFESGGEGAAPWTWEVSDNETNPALEFVANPNMVAPNTSAMVAKFTARALGNPWALCFSDSIGSFTFDANNSTVKIMVWKTRMSDVAIKFEEVGNSSTAIEMKVANTKTSEWEELTFDFSSVNGNTYDRMAIIPDFLARTAENVLYFDNITFSSGVTLSEPMVAAPNPTYPADSVISLFSNAYTDVTVSTWRTAWSTSTLTDIQVAGNDVKKYSGMDVVGIETGVANLIDASNMEHINFDMWTPNSTKLKFKLVDWGADGAYQGGDDSEFELSFDAPALDSWVNYHIPLTDFTGLTARAHIAQILFVSEPAGTSVNYLDNLFFSKETAMANSIMSANAFSQLSIYPNPVKDNLNIKVTSASQTILNYSIISMNGQTIQSEKVNASTLNKSINTAGFDAGIYFVKINTNQGTYTHKIIIH